MRFFACSFVVGALLVFPAMLLADNKILDKGKVYNVPYRLTDTAHVMVRVKINGKGPYNYIIDTGAPVTFVSTKVAKELGIVANKKKEAVVKRFEVEGGVANRKVMLRVHTPFQLEGMNAMNFAGAELHGIIGYDFLAKYKMEFDFSHHKMKWTRLNFAPPPPQFLKGKGGAPAELSAISAIMKMMSWIVGKKASPKLIAGGYLGVEVTQAKNSVTVAKVYPQSPAGKAGLQSGDRILQVHGKHVASISDVMRRTAAMSAGKTVELLIQRGNKKKKLSVTAGEGL